MKKYIAVVNPSMDEDEITTLIRKGVAGALFEISHQNYPVAIKMIKLIQELSQKTHHPISIIQDVSSMEDPLDLQVGLKSGVHWIASDKEDHLKMARGLNKLAGLIFRGRKLPKNIQVDSIMDGSFIDPDAQVIGTPLGEIKHLTTDHKDQKLIDALMRVAHEINSSSIAVSDFGLARALSYRRPSKKIIFAPKDTKHAGKAGIYWGVHPVFGGEDLFGAIRNSHTVKKGERVVNATDAKHIEIHVI